MVNSLPEKYIDPLGGNSLQYVLVWFFIAAWTFIDPGFFQRSAAAKNPTVAKNGILIAIFFWAIFDIMTITCGLYAINYLKGGSPLLTYPLLAIDFLPIGFLGIFFMSIFAVLMSTIDSLSFISAITFGRDILWRINSDNKKIDLSKFTDSPICIIIGPEGDFSEAERAQILLYKSVQSIKINNNILRSETAVISALSIVSYLTN